MTLSGQYPTDDLIRKDKRFIWHPFTEMTSWIEGEPLIIAQGDGARLADTQGNWYIDGVSSLWTNVHGHRVPEIDNAVRDQLDRVAHSTLLGLGNVPSIVFAEKLARHLPKGLERIFYSDNGATAVEVALKLAFSHWHARGKPEKSTFIRFEGAYHGDTIGSVSVGGIDLFHSLFRPLLFDAPIAPYPFCYRCPIGKDRDSCHRECFGAVAEVIEANAHRAAGVIIEPMVQGASGIRPAPKGFLKFLKEVCDSSDLLLIADEVATGFGRTGRMFACEHENVAPDLMCMAKGISGGYLPLAATAVSERIFESFLGAQRQVSTFFHGHTYTGNPLACAAAAAGIDLFESRKVLEGLPEKIAELEKGLEHLSRHPHVGHVRNIGLMAGVELVEQRTGKAPFEPVRKIGAAVCLAVRKYGVILRPLGDVIVIMPPLCISPDEIGLIFRGIEAALKDCGLGSIP